MITTDQSQRLDWYVRKKTDATITITCTLASVAFDISSYTFIAEVFAYGNPTPILTPTIVNGGVTGVLTLSLTDTNLNIPADDYFWILRTTAPNDNFWVNGQFTVNGQLWDDATTSTANLTINLGAQNIAMAITLAGSALNGTVVFCGIYDASINLFPSTGGTLASGIPAKANQFLLSVGGILGGVFVPAGVMIMAKVDTPGQTASNWILPTAF